MKDEKKSNNKVLKPIANIIGSGTGAAIGTVLGGPLGTIAGSSLGGVLGAATTDIITKIGEEFSERALSKRENFRVGSTLQIAVEKIRTKLENGEQIRTDLFASNSNERTAIEEIVEGILLVA